MTKKQSQKGFSLIELVVVMTIIGILTALGLPQVTEYIAKARRAEVQSNLSNLHSAQKSFHTQWSSYYTNLAAIGWFPEGELNFNYGFTVAGGVPTAGFVGGANTASMATDAANALCAPNRATAPIVIVGTSRAQACYRTTLAQALAQTVRAPRAIIVGGGVDNTPTTPTATVTGFRAIASSSLDGDAAFIDRWEINHQNRVNQFSSGLQSNN